MSLLDLKLLNKTPENNVERFYKATAPLLQEKINKLSEMASFGNLVVYRTYGYTSYGDWSTHDLLFYLLKHIGPSIVYFSTWGLSETAVRLLNTAKEEGLITKLYAVVDRRIEIRNSAINAMLDQTITEKVLVDCHAKVFVIEGEQYSVVNQGSANMTNNRRIETGLISFEDHVVRFHKDWIMNEIIKGREKYEGVN